MNVVTKLSETPISPSKHTDSICHSFTVLIKLLQPDVDPGNIRVSLSYKRETMMLTVLVMEACNLLLSTGADKTNRLTGSFLN